MGLSFAGLDIGIVVLVLILTAMTDAMHAVYVRSVIAVEPFRAATLRSLIGAINAIAIIQYTHNATYLIFAIIGSWIGSYASVAYAHRKKNRNK